MPKPKPKYSVKNAKYWADRSLERLEEAEKNSLSYLRRIRKNYEVAATQITESVRKMYTTYYKGNGFNVSALRNIAPSGDIKRFKAELARAGLVQDLPDNYKGRMDRLELLQAQVWAEVKKAAQLDRGLSAELYHKTIHDAYYHTIYDTSQGMSADLTFSKLNDRTIDKILEAKFYGKNFSQRIWGNSNNSIEKIQDILAQGVMSGQEYSKMAADLRRAFGVEQWQAERLLRTETNYFENKGELEAYKALGFKRYQILAVLDNRTSDICRDQDHRIYWLKDLKQGENAPPFHPNCRSTVIAYFGKEFEPTTRIARSSSGETYYINNISYLDWLKVNRIDIEVDKQAATPVSVASGYTLADVFSDVRPNIGTTTVEGTSNGGKSDEKVAVNWLKQKVGGDYVLLSESRIPGVKMPDLMRDSSELIEVKKVSSATSIDNQVRSALKQLSLDNLKKIKRFKDKKYKTIILLHNQDNSIAMLTKNDVIGIVAKRLVRSYEIAGTLDWIIVKLKNRTELVLKVKTP